jgi:hypothetical protein
MHETLASLIPRVAVVVALGLPGIANAQNAAPVLPAPAPTPVAEEPKPVPSYFRIDHDYMFGLQVWAGATYPLTDKIGLATDIYLAENSPYGVGIDATGTPRLANSW